MGKLRPLARSSVASYVVCNLPSSTSEFITCGVHRFAVSNHKGVIYSSGGFVLNVLNSHGVVLDPSIKGGVRGAVRQPTMGDIGAKYERRWFVVTAQEMMGLQGVGDPNALAQCLWRYHCTNLIKRAESIELSVESRRMLFPDLGNFATRVSISSDRRLLNREERIRDSVVESKAMLMRDYDCGVDLSLMMDTYVRFTSFSDFSVDSSVQKFEVCGLNEIKMESDAGPVIREAGFDFSLTFRPDLKYEDFSRLRGENDIRIFGGCPRCYVLLGFYNCVTMKFKMAPDIWTSFVCSACRFSGGVYSDHPREWPQAGLSVVTQIIWEARFILPGIDFTSVRFGLISKCYGGRGLFFSEGGPGSCDSHVEFVNILKGVLMCYDYGVKYAHGEDINVLGLIPVAGVEFLVCVLRYHEVFSHGYAFMAGTSTYGSITYAAGSDAVLPLVSRSGIRLYNVAMSRDCNEIFIIVDSNAQPVDIGWVRNWLNTVSYRNSHIRFWLFRQDDSDLG